MWWCIQSTTRIVVDLIARIQDLSSAELLQLERPGVGGTLHLNDTAHSGRNPIVAQDLAGADSNFQSGPGLGKPYERGSSNVYGGRACEARH